MCAGGWRLEAGGWRLEAQATAEAGDITEVRGEGLVLGEDLAAGGCRVLLLRLPLPRVQTSSLGFSFPVYKTWARNPQAGSVPTSGACVHGAFGSVY